MFNPWFNWTMLALESQQVVMLRMMKLAAGGPEAQAEANRMVMEKLTANAQASVKLMTGASSDSVVSSYRKKVRANRRRLAK